MNIFSMKTFREVVAITVLPLSSILAGPFDRDAKEALILCSDSVRLEMQRHVC